MYSSCAHCKQNCFYKSKCCWTYRTVAPRQSKRFNENALTFSHSTVRMKLKFLSHTKLYECATTMKSASIDHIAFRTTYFRKLPQPGRFRSTTHKTIYTARQWLRIFLYLLYNFLLYRVTRD